MRTWWTRLTSSPPAMVGVGVLVLALVVGGVLLLRGSDNDAPGADPASAATTDTPGGDDPAAAASETPSVPTSPLPPDPDRYCPAYAEIREGGLTRPGRDEDAPVDLAELTRTFTSLVDRYQAAARVAPEELRDDYAQALQYLRQGRRAAAAEDVELLRALVVNLDALDATIAEIQAASDRLCR